MDLVFTQVSLCRHVAVTTITHSLLNLQEAGAIQPDVIGQVGRTQLPLPSGPWQTAQVLV